jgi:hypothetical protein
LAFKYFGEDIDFKILFALTTQTTSFFALFSKKDTLPAAGR